MAPTANGLTMNICEVACDAARGMRLDQFSIFSSAEISPLGDPVNLAAAASAEYSRVREMAK